MSDAFIGEIRMLGFNFPPKNWAACDGQLLLIAQNTALFSILGTTYGGNGTTNFGLPDFRGRVPISFGQGPGLSDRTQGEIAGVESVTLVAAEIPTHNHGGAPLANVAVGASKSPSGSFPATPAVNVRFRTMYSNAAADTQSATSLPSVGLGQAHANIMPYQCILFAICQVGVFPPRP